MTDSSAPAQTPARQRLEAARAQAADLADRRAATITDAATTDDGPRVAQVGETVHAVRSGFSVPQSLPTEWIGGPGVLPLTRGDELVITQRHVDAARDRLGGPGWLGLVHDAEAQRRRWGHVVLVPGPAPAGLERWIRGDRDWSDARERAMLAATDHSDPVERADAVAAVNAKFGAPPESNSSRTVYRGDAGDLPRSR
ncbi:hypothetical protein [Microbacterium testaceum]|uniref:hypothetical protein n=1 Tax=Microbacterium testaceum TaxID=2033 RepID=UPI0012AD14DB|nr:hypothetical protein [Microbacterium testaceum]